MIGSDTVHQTATGYASARPSSDPEASRVRDGLHELTVAMLSYSMFTQIQGGLEIQVRETIDALQRIGCHARLIDPFRERLGDFDLVHVFGAGSGNFRIVQTAKQLGCPVVMSPLIQPNWNRAYGRRAKLIDRVVGRLTRWGVSTEYGDLRRGLAGSDRLYALGTTEKKCIVEAFEIDPAKVKVVPNGIPPRFFEAQPGPFLERTGLQPGFALNVATINPHKNQLALARALAKSGIDIVMIGECVPKQRGYLDEVLAVPRTHYIGRLNYADPLLASAYAAAGVFCLPSYSEVMPLTVLESLASGRPAVVTRHHAMDLGPMAACVTEIEPGVETEIRDAVEHWRRAPPAAADCKVAVAHLTWDGVRSS